jgi:rfaE bifunctional protein nucleotidyltransferase chain/domain
MRVAPSPPRVVYTAGVFDMLHAGHVSILWRSKALGDVLVVGVVSDSGCAAYKGRRPSQNIQQRMEAVRRLGWVDVVELQHTTDPSENLFRFRPDIMTHGDDWDELLEGNDTLADLGIEFRLLPYTEGVSTTILRDRKVPA